MKRKLLIADLLFFLTFFLPWTTTADVQTFTIISASGFFVLKANLSLVLIFILLQVALFSFLLADHSAGLLAASVIFLIVFILLIPKLDGFYAEFANLFKFYWGRLLAMLISLTAAIFYGLTYRNISRSEQGGQS